MIKATGNLEFIVLSINGSILKYEYWKNKKLISNYNFDIIEEKDSKLLFTTLMKHNEDIPLVISWEDLRFLRKVGIRI